ncbi:cyclic nucleotide-binding domain-containing protein [Myxococcota bacterium]|nr:cyclic nucleotide-binding domain-containing protein [Myxococcota bacterium]
MAGPRRSTRPSRGTSRPGDDEPAATLRASALLSQLTDAQQAAFLRHLPAPVALPGVGAPVSFADLPAGGFALLTAPSRLLFFVERKGSASPASAGPTGGRRARRPEPASMPPEGDAAVAGAGDDDWTRGDVRDDGTTAITTVPTLFGGTAVFPVVARHLRLRTEVPSGYYRITPEILDTLAADPAFGRPALERLVTALRIDAVLATAPALRRSAGRQRAVVGASMEVRPVATGEVLVTRGESTPGLWVVSGAGRVEITRTGLAGETVYEAGFGTVFGGEALVPGPPPASAISVRAVEPTEVLRLPHPAIRELLQHDFGAARDSGADWFRRFAATFQELDAQTEILVSYLRALPVIGALDAEHLHALLQGAELLRWRLNWPDPEPVNQVAGFGLVLEGELARVGARPGREAEADPQAVVPQGASRPGESFGLLDMVLGQPVARVWQARTPARVVFILRHRCLEVLDRVSSYLRPILEVRQAERTVQTARARITAAGPDAAPVVLFQVLGSGQARPHLPGLLGALADTVAADFGEPCAVLPHETPDAAALEASVKAARKDAAIRWVFATAPLEPSLWGLADRVVFLHGDRAVPWPPQAPRVPSVFTTALPPDVAVTDAGRPSRNVFPPNRVRLTMSLAGLPREADAWRRAFPADFSRWARAVTDRRVGVALGGGGAWGFAHLAVLYHLEAQGIPVDLVSGASFGSVVGAFYAARQREGLMSLLKHGRALNLTTQLAFVTYVPLQRLLDRVLGQRRLEDLIIPFFPATTDVVSGSEDAVSRGTLGEGVRASGGLAPMLPPTRTAFATWVDGGMVANVPAGVLRQEGARFVVSSNVVPPPETRPQAPLLPRWYGQLLADLNPLARMEAAMASWMTAMATIGEYAASSADVQFDASLPRALPTNMDDGVPILQNAVSNPAFWDALQSAREHWESLRRPRRRAAPP